MFDFVRNNTKIMMALLFLLIIPSFVLFGIEGYSRFFEQGAVVARVDGQSIRQTDWDNAHKEEVERIRDAMPDVDIKLLDTPEARYASLERLVQNRVLAAAAAKLHLTASDARLAHELEREPAIAALRGADGKLDLERYRQMLGRQGMTPESFEARMRADLSSRQVVQGLTVAGFVPAASSDVALDALLQRREVQVARFEPQAFANQINPTDAELQAFYKDNEGLFQSPEQADIEYMVLDVDALKQTVSVNEADLRTYYDQNLKRYQTREERRASHILIAADKQVPAAEREKAKARAQELLAAVRAAPNSFAEVARKNSQDPGSAPRGGDLDFFGRDAMTPPFENAVFSMDKGAISDVVETDFGYHIIRLDDIRPASTRSYEAVRPELENEVRKQQAQRKFAEEANDFTNGVYEQSDSLKPVADKLKLPIQTASRVQRTPQPGATGVLANPKFLQALFSSDTIDKKRNTDAIETGSNQLASGRITQYTPARTRPFAEVKDDVRARLLASRSAQMARDEGLRQLAAWKAASPAAAALPPATIVSRDQPGGLPREVIEAALAAPSATLPVWAGADLGSQGYAVVRVNKVLPRETPPEVARQVHDQYQTLWNTAEGTAYLDQLKKQFKAEILAPKPAASAK